MSILFQEHSSNQRLFSFFYIKTLTTSFPLYEREVSKINSFTNGVLDKKWVEISFLSLRSPKNLTLLKDIIEDLGSSNVSRALLDE